MKTTVVIVVAGITLLANSVLAISSPSSTPAAGFTNVKAQFTGTRFTTPGAEQLVQILNPILELAGEKYLLSSGTYTTDIEEAICKSLGKTYANSSFRTLGYGEAADQKMVIFSYSGGFEFDAKPAGQNVVTSITCK